MVQTLKDYLFKPRFHFSRFQLNLVATFFLLAGIIGGSYLTLSNILPNVFALNDTNKVWTFNTANSASYTTSLTTVDDTGAHPTGGQVGANEFTNPSFTSDASSWSGGAVNGSTTPAGWVVVPGNSGTYSTNDFLVMKYEAKNNGSNQAVSQATGTPYVFISQTDSITKCAAVSVSGGNAHLITNNEWMTIARNAELQTANWYGGTVGSNFMFMGHNDNGPASALAASSDDNLPYTGTNDSASSCDGVYSNFAVGDDTITGRACVGQKRTLSLSNGSVV